MTFNQTRLKQLNIHTIHLRTYIADRKIAEFQGRHHTVRTTFHLTNTTSRMYQKQRSSSFKLIYF